MSKILVFGYFGYVTNQLDGQTVKTRAIYDLLKAKSQSHVQYADTQEFRRGIKPINKFFKALFTCNTLIWLPAHNNLKFLFPIIWYASKLFHFDIIYVVVGGWLSTILKQLPFHRKRLGQIKSILVENSLTVEELRRSYQFENVGIIPNFREVAPQPIFKKNDGSLKIVYMARINRKKGLDTIAACCPHLPQNVIIDFYGPIHSEDEEYFFNDIINKYPFAHYKGVLAPEKINKVLQEYDMMILPTHYYTEGFPGSVLDAFQAGIPVIVTRWKHADEFVINGKNGIIVDFDNPVPEIINQIDNMCRHPEGIINMKMAAYNSSKEYSPEKAWAVISSVL